MHPFATIKGTAKVPGDFPGCSFAGPGIETRTGGIFMPPASPSYISGSRYFLWQAEQV